ncbi:MAG: thioredoxin family protein [Betaproteobacteria bacterium]|nr:thioredoxin family protein [Betaproteobacteria bacterium]
MKAFWRFVAICLFTGFACQAMAMVETGKTAPGFRLQSLESETVTLEQFKGRWVVLEWVNPNCPFVQKHYSASNMQSLQQYATTNKFIWLQINSTHPGHPEYRTASAMKAWNAQQQAKPSFGLLDPQGIVGRAYGARTTPQMVLISPTGVLVYHGAIDSIRSASPGDIPKAIPYLRQAIEESLAGKAVSTATSVPYGCSVKYASN